MQLPTTPQEPNLTPTAFKWLLMAQPGMGKSSFLASIPNILIVDPDNGCQALPAYITQVRNWMDCKELLKALQQMEKPSTYSWIGLDLLNILYEFAYNHECKRMGIVYPSDLEGGKARGKGRAIITKEFMSWVRDMGNLGIPLIGTCHVNMVEISVKSRTFNRAIVSFPGGSATTTYQKIKEAFDIVGYITFDTDNPGIETDTKEKLDLRKVITPDTEMLGLAKHQLPEFSNARVIYFQASQYWDSSDTSMGQLPAKVVLPSDWREDWNTILANWGTEEKS